METNNLRALKDYVKECVANLSNTTGMGNVSFPTDTTVGSGDTFQFRNIKRNKKLKLHKLTLNKNSKLKETNEINK